MMVLEYEGQFRDDKLVGMFIYYYLSKYVKVVIVYNENLGCFVVVMYYENGCIMVMGIYRNQFKDSVWNYYGFSGWLFKLEIYKVDKFDGEFIVYYVFEESLNKV